jgi:hypothetical protein
MNANEIVFLLGAGASYEAQIPVSNDMVVDVEKFVTTKESWKPYNHLYYYLKSSILYSKGIFGEFNQPFNIEDLLIVLEALVQRDKNIMYPYIGNWNMRLVEFSGKNFENIESFKSLIKEQISEWVKPKRGYDEASYYEGFCDLQNELGKTLKVFSLNYDLCFERVIEKKPDIVVELGFSDRIWHYKNFDSIESRQIETHFALYKLHGSINWEKNEDGNLLLKDDPTKNAELIFGLPYKLTSSDPYFFYATEFRKSLLDDQSRIFVCIGYSFYDEYLNQFIAQAMKDDQDKVLLVVTYCSDADKEYKAIEVSQYLSSKKDNFQIETKRIIIYNKGAKLFLQENMKTEYFEGLTKSSGPF